MNNIIEISQIDAGAVEYLVRNLEKFEKDKAIKHGLYAAGNVFDKGGKNRLKTRMKCGSRGFTGNLLGSFRVRLKKNRPGVLVGFRQGKGGGSHSYLIDRGTDERHWTKKNKNKSTGRVAGNYFWSDTEAQDSAKAMNKLYEGIERAVNRINNRQ
jgi:hypothetical protein